MITASLSLLILVTLGGDAAGGDDEKTKKKPIKIQCKADARVRGAELLLRDLAKISAPDAARTKRLMNLSFGRRPNSNYNRIMSRDEIMARLFREGFRARDIQIEGAKEIVVHPLSTVIEPSDILEVANPALDAVLALEGNRDVESKVRSKLRTLRVPPGRISLDLKAEVNGRVSETAARIDVSILVDDKVYKVVPVHYRLQRFYHVLVTRGVVRKGSLLGPQSLVLKRLEKPVGSTIYLTSFEQVKGRVSSRALRSGQTLTLSNLARPAVIRKGQIVTVVSIAGRIKVVARAQALADGSVGSFIRLKTLDARSPRQLVAQVHGPGVCVVAPLR